MGNPYVVYEEVAALLAKSTNGAVAARRETGSGRWRRPVIGEVRTTRTLQVAQSHLQRGQAAQALQVLTNSIQSAEGLPEAVQEELLVQRGWLRFLRGDARGALSDYAMLPNDGNRGPTVRARRALFAIAVGDDIRALAEAAQAIAQNSKNPWGYCARAWVYASRRADHDLERAQEDIRTARELGADPFVAFTQAQVTQLAQMQRPGPQQRQRQSSQMQALQNVPATWARLFPGQVAVLQVSQRKK